MRSFDGSLRRPTHCTPLTPQAAAQAARSDCDAELVRTSAPTRTVKRWGVRALLTRGGLLGLLFFLAKGLLWLAVPYVLFLMGLSE